MMLKRMLLSLCCLFLVIGTGISQDEDSSGGEFSVIPTQDFPQMSPSLTLNPTPSSMDIAQSIAESAFPDSSVYGTTPSMSVSSITVSSQYLSNQQFIPSSVYSSEHVLTSSPRPILTILSFFSNAVQSTDIPVVQSSPEFVIAPQSIAIVGPDVTSILILSSGSVESMANPEMSVMASSTPFIGVRTTTTAVSTPPTMLPTDPGENTGILDLIEEFFRNSTFTIVVAVGGSCILLLLLAIIVVCCCFCCRRRKGHYTIENSTENVDATVGNRYRRNTTTISDPIPSYKMALKNVQAQRQQLEDFVETELGPESKADDVLHYQGHSQVQHSQPYSPPADVGTSQSLSKLTPFNASQIMSQARGGISVDDIEEEIPEKDGQATSSSRADGGGDSPFMHLSDNLTGSRGRISQRSLSDPHTDTIGNVAQPSQASQYSHLGLGVLHGGDVVFTNTASLAEDMHSSIGMIGIDQSLLLSKDSDLHSHRTASPLLVETSADLDETPVREKPNFGIPNDRKLKGLTSLTSLTSLEPTKIPRSSTQNVNETGKKLNLSLITSLNSSPEKSEKGFTHSDNMHSNLQETPERYRRHTVESSAFKRHPGKSSQQSRLGKLTSLEYIRASLRMKLNRIKGGDENETKKKPLKSAMRKMSFNSQNSSPDSANSSKNNSFIYSNTHAFSHYNDVSPQHQLPPTGPHYGHPHDPYLRSPNLDEFPLVGMPGNIESGYGPMSGMYPPGPSYPRGDPYMMALSPAGGGYLPEPLSPILSVSQFDHPGMYPAHEIGILPQYGNRMHPSATMMGGYHDQAFPPKPPHYDDEDDDYDDDIPALHSPFRTPGDQGGGTSQRNVTWNLENVEISMDPENLTPSDIDDDL